jgi:hypothetical protein
MTFQSGKSGNPGGKPSRARQELNDLLDVTFPPAKRRKVLKRLVEDAEQGNHEARVLLLAYTFGKPVERKEVSGPDGIPLKTYIGIDVDAWDDTEETTE